MRRFRFGYQATTGGPSETARLARKAEEAGFDVFQVGDHVGAEPSALLSLAAAALATERIRVGTLVLNNDFHHPVTLAQELATLDHLSGGRLEVGLGAGHSFTEYAAMGENVRPARERARRAWAKRWRSSAPCSTVTVSPSAGTTTGSTTQRPWRPCRSTSPSSSA